MSDSFDIKADARTYRVDIDPGAAMAFLQAQGAWTPRAAVPEEVDGPNPPAVAMEPAAALPP